MQHLIPKTIILHVDKTISMHRKLASSVKEFLSPNLLTVEGDRSLLEAAKLMSSVNIGSLVVIKGSEPLGIITERDIINTIADDSVLSDTKVEAVMSTPVISIDSTLTVQDALVIMSKENIRHLLVTEKERAIGMFSFKNFLDLERLRIGILSDTDI